MFNSSMKEYAIIMPFFSLNRNISCKSGLENLAFFKQ